jgi:hypothetical protein
MVFPRSVKAGIPYEMHCWASGTMLMMVSRSCASVLLLGSSSAARYSSISFVAMLGFSIAEQIRVKRICATEPLLDRDTTLISSDPERGRTTLQALVQGMTEWKSPIL